MLRLTVNNTELPLPDNAGIALTRELFDPLNPGARKSDYSKTFTIPGSPAVNKLFGQIWNLQQRVRSASTAQFSPDFNPKKKATAILDNDGIVLIRGFIRLVSVSYVNEKDIAYEVTLHGVQADFFTAIRDKKLKDLDFSDLNHELNRANITATWDSAYFRDGIAQAFAYGEGYMYPLIQTAEDRNANNWEWWIEQFKPALFVREICSKIFTDAGFTWSSDSFLNDNVFKRLIVPAEPHAFDIDEAAIEAREFLAQHTGGDLALTAATNTTAGTKLTFANDSTGGNFDNGSLWNTTNSTYTVDVTGTHSFRAVIELDLSYPTGSLNVYDSHAFFELRTSTGKVIASRSAKVLNGGDTTSNPTIDLTFDNVQLTDGDILSLHFADLRLLYPGLIYLVISPSDYTIEQKNSSTFTGSCTGHSWGEGHTVDFIRFFKCEFTQEQFISSLCKMFNLVVDFNPSKPTELILKPYNDYFTGITNLDALLDQSQDITSIPLGELTAQEYTFSYQKGSDPESENIVAQFGDTYGSYRYKVPNDFVTEKAEIKPIFSSSPLYNDNGESNIVCSWGPSTDKSNNSKDGQIRILYYAGLKTADIKLLAITDKTNTLKYDEYPLTAHIDDTESPTLDICFGMPPVVNIAGSWRLLYTNNNLFNKYWRKFITQITDTDSRVVTAWFWLNPLDYNNLTFSSFYQFEGQNFRLLKVEDYNPNGDSLTKLTFLRSVEPAAFTPSTGRKGRGYDSTDGYSDKFPGDWVADPRKKPLPVDPIKGNVVKGTGNNVPSDSVVVLGRNNVVSGPEVVVIGGGDNQVTGSRVVLIQSDSQTVRDDDVFMLQNQKVNLAGAVDGSPLKYDEADNEWRPDTDPQWTGIFATTDQIVNNSDTLTDDSTMQFSMEANKVYHIRGTIVYETDGVADFKCKFTGPASPTEVTIVLVDGVGNHTIFNSYDTLTNDVSSSGRYAITFSAIVVNGANAGTFKFQFAQNTANASNTKRKAGSAMEYKSQPIAGQTTVAMDYLTYAHTLYDVAVRQAFTRTMDVNTYAHTLQDINIAYGRTVVMANNSYALTLQDVTIRKDLVLDTWGSAAGAWAFTKLRTAYSGNCIKVRRASDSATQDIGFSGNDLDTAAIGTFCSGTTGYIHTIYDQSGNGNNLVMTTAASQPLIYSGGAVRTVGGLPSCQFDGSDDYMTLTSSITADASWTSCMVGKRSASATLGIALCGNGIRQYSVYHYSDDYLYIGGDDGPHRSASTNTSSSQYHLMGIYKGTTADILVNGTSASPSYLGFAQSGSFVDLGRRSASSEYQSGDFQLLILWKTDQTSNQSGIDTRIRNIYSL